jgi:hypothetical protein
MITGASLGEWPARRCSNAMAACATFCAMGELDLIIAFMVHPLEALTVPSEANKKSRRGGTP